MHGDLYDAHSAGNRRGLSKAFVTVSLCALVCTCAPISLQFTNPIASSLIFVHHNVTVSLKESKQGVFQLCTVWVWLSTGCPSPSPEPSSVRLDTRPPPETYYAHGTSDFLNVAFYSLVWIIIHAMLQEYIWEVRPGLTSPSVCCEVTGFVSLPQLTQRTVKRLHLSKTKTSKYFDSGCLAVFYLVSVVWGLDIIIKSGYATDPTQLWVGYPHDLMR